MAFLEHWFDEVWNKRNEAAIDKLALPNAITHGLEHPEGDKVPDREAFKAFHEKLCSTFSKIHIDVKHSITVDDLDIAACEVTAVLPKADGREEKTIKFTGLCVARIKDGKLAEGWNDFDFPSMYQHL